MQIVVSTMLVVIAEGLMALTCCAYNSSMSAICNDARWQQAMKVVTNFQCYLQCCVGVIYISDYECSFAVIQVVMSSASSSDHMQASQYTFKIVQLCTPEPCKQFLMSNKRKRRPLCMQQVNSSSVVELCLTKPSMRSVASRRVTVLLCFLV